ncbi:prepilin-type N-terminal cleavage/methylation domain-containing protein (plasmid) [Fusobacteria bacterium ZRK30]|nr:prepilin-type N-terminal cleavage/methylation domain-containing protein [Fusobacteria bacterium ZRK30]
MNKKNGFTIIELLIIIAIIGILAVTAIPKLRKELNKGKVAKIQHKLGLIRSKLSIESNISFEFPDLVSNDINLLNKFDIHPTEPFSSDSNSYGETDKVVSARDNSGGWYYIKEEGEIYANLPNGAYTGDPKYEIWNDKLIKLSDLQNLEDVGDVKAMEVNDRGEYINNPSFENLNTGVYAQVDASSIEHWNTTASDNKIEVWSDGFLGVPAADGNHFLELNANEVASLYQEVVTIPGTVLKWSINHRGRLGEDTATISVGNGEDAVILETMKDSNDQWGTYTGTYIVPEGQTVTTFYLNSVDSTGGNKTVGNLIDNFSVKADLNED